MRLSNLPLFLLAGVASAVEPAAPITPAEVQTQLAPAVARDATLWSDYDIDRDRKVSQVEVIVSLARRPAWLRDHLPQAFAAIDADGDHAISFAELKAFAGRAPAGGFTIAQHERSVKERTNIGAAAAGGPGTSIGVGGGGGHAYAYFGSQQAYIADYDVVNGQYDPVIGVLGTGVVLDVGDVRITTVRERR
jgi:hypothetical protein